MTRLDIELVNRKLVPTRTKAQELIKSEFVKCNGVIITKPNYNVEQTDNLSIVENDRLKFVSRAGLKLEKAINDFKINLKDKVVMDIGSSTGGFTDCALKNGAKKVVAVDVGTDLLDVSLRNDKRVELHEQTNFKDLESKYFLDIDIFVCDVSFISLKHIIKKIVDEQVKTEIICLIKPQFECGKEIAKKYKGVILNKSVHKDIIKDLFEYFNANNFYVENMAISPIKGGDGNIEYLVKLSNLTNKNTQINIESIVDFVFNNKG